MTQKIIRNHFIIHMLKFPLIGRSSITATSASTWSPNMPHCWPTLSPTVPPQFMRRGPNTGEQSPSPGLSCGGIAGGAACEGLAACVGEVSQTWSESHGAGGREAACHHRLAWWPDLAQPAGDIVNMWDWPQWQCLEGPGVPGYSYFSSWAW